MRYIDADKFIAELEQEKTVALEFEDGVAVYEIEHMMNLIGMQPTADVVPKSEVDRLEKLFNDMTQEAKGYLNRIYGIRADVAREIFEEIEKTTFSFGFGVRGDMTVAHTRTIDDDFLAELKKKYTEDTI